MKYFFYITSKVFLYALFIQYFLFFKLSSSPIIIFKWDNNLKNINKCNTKITTESLKFQPKNFIDLNNFPSKEIENASIEEGNSRYNQIQCLKKLDLSSLEKLELKKNYQYFRQREIESIEFLKNFLLNFDKENKFAPGEKMKVMEYIKIKTELYSILDQKTEYSLFRNENSSEKEFISIYQSLFRVHFDLLNSVSPELRKILLKKMYNT